MRTTSETSTQTLQFKRGKKVGLNILELTEGESVFVEIQSQDTFTSKNYPDGIEYFNVVDLKTGEEMRMWIDGGLKGTLSNLGGLKNVVGMKLEIKKGKQKPFLTEEGENVKVNTYEVWTLT